MGTIAFRAIRDVLEAVWRDFPGEQCELPSLRAAGTLIAQALLAAFSPVMTLDYVLAHDMSAASARFQLYLPSGGSQESGGRRGQEEEKSFV